MFTQSLMAYIHDTGDNVPLLTTADLTPAELEARIRLFMAVVFGEDDALDAEVVVDGNNETR